MAGSPSLNEALEAYQAARDLLEDLKSSKTVDAYELLEAEEAVEAARERLCSNLLIEGFEGFQGFTSPPESLSPESLTQIAIIRRVIRGGPMVRCITTFIKPRNCENGFTNVSIFSSPYARLRDLTPVGDVLAIVPFNPLAQFSRPWLALCARWWELTKDWQPDETAPAAGAGAGGHYATVSVMGRPARTPMMDTSWADKDPGLS